MMWVVMTSGGGGGENDGVVGYQIVEGWHETLSFPNCRWLQIKGKLTHPGDKPCFTAEVHANTLIAPSARTPGSEVTASQEALPVCYINRPPSLPVSVTPFFITVLAPQNTFTTRYQSVWFSPFLLFISWLLEIKASPKISKRPCCFFLTTGI